MKIGDKIKGLSCSDEGIHIAEILTDWFGNDGSPHGGMHYALVIDDRGFFRILIFGTTVSSTYGDMISF